MESKQWSLTERELATLLRTNQIPISSASPLGTTIRAQLAGGSHLFLKSIEPDLHRAIEAVAQPRLEIGLLLSPPHANNINWFYSGGEGRADGLAGYRITNGDNYQFVWTSEQELMAPIRSCLHLDVPTDAGGFSLDLSVGGYQTFLALVDCNRERTLESLLKRSPNSERHFSANHVFDTFMRNYRSGDWRWLVALARAISPFDFQLNEAECQKGLRDIAERGLLEKDKDGWTLSPLMQLICATLSSPLAYCAMNRRRFVSPERSEQENLVAMRCMGSLWLIEFKGLDSSEPHVRIHDSSGEEVELVISQKLHEWEPMPPLDIAPVRSGAEGSTEIRCERCGQANPASMKFCGACGKALLTTEQASPAQAIGAVNTPGASGAPPGPRMRPTSVPEAD